LVKRGGIAVVGNVGAVVFMEIGVEVGVWNICCGREAKALSGEGVEEFATFARGSADASAKVWVFPGSKGGEVATIRFVIHIEFSS
jgi:hypothetical protein